MGKHELDVCAGTVLVVFSIMANFRQKCFFKRLKSNFFPTGYPDIAAAVQDKNIL